jgi:DNA-directed RNA polymerase specialized sigma24 family protein
MPSCVEGLNTTIFAPIIQQVRQAARDDYRDIFEGHRHRIFSLAFYMTDSELAAENLLTDVFCQAFSRSSNPEAEMIDRVLVSELRRIMPIGGMTLNCRPEAFSKQLRTTARVSLERAVVQLPPTERLVFLMHDVEGYEHSRIARTIGITETDAKRGLLQARLRIRELLADRSQA